MATTINPNIIQMFLLSSSDILKNKLQYTKPSNIIKIDEDGNRSYSSEEILEIQKRTQQLFSTSIVPTPEIAYEIFSNLQQENATRENSYTIQNEIILMRNNTSDNSLEPIYFNIDTANKSLQSKILFKKLDITNKSKDIFTAKSNYAVRLSIAFTKFEDLLEENIVGKNKNGDSINISVLNLIFPNYRKNGTTPITLQEVKDSNGILLTQTLNIVDVTKFKNLNNFLGSNSIKKNYHLIIKNHTFEVFKEEDPISRLYENELQINFVAYDVDATAKPGKNSSIPAINSNLFNLLKTPSIGVSKTLDVFYSELIKLQEKLAKQNNYLSCVQEFTRLKEIFENNNQNNSQLKTQEAQTRLQELQNVGTLNADTKEIKKNIKNIQDEINILKFEIKRNLVLKILENINVYKLEVPSSLLGVYEKNFEISDFTNALSFSGLLSFTTTGASLGSAFGGIGAAIGAGAGAAGYIGSVLTSEILKEPLITDQLNIKNIRDQINSSSFFGAKLDQKLETKLQQLFGNEKITIQNNQQVKSVSEAISNAGKIDAPEENDTNNTVLIYFTTLGDIINLLTKIDDGDKIKFVLGGKNFAISTDGEEAKYSYVNFADIPVSINLLFSFLSKNILNSERLEYDTDVFTKDIFQNLLKDSLLNQSPGLKNFINSFSPTSLKINSSIHVVGDSDKSILFKDLKPLSDTDSKLYKRVFSRTKNLEILKSSPNNFYKLFIICENQDIKFYNFYKNYGRWATSNDRLKSANNYSSYDFQEYINKKHLIPCVLTEYTTQYENILKKKNVTFTRTDNQNLLTGQILSDSPFLRLPYSVSSDFKIFISFFMDIGSLMFVAPPPTGTSALSSNQVFGIGGLYVINEATLEYNFQLLKDGKPSLPNDESKYKLSGILLSFGDGLKLGVSPGNSATAINCKDAASPVSTAPYTKIGQ